MRIVDVQQRGKRGKIVASRNRFGQYIKEFVPHKQPASAAQREVWGTMTELSWVWNEISDERREAWRRRAEQVHSRPTLAQSGPLDGILLFKKINSVLRICRRDALLDPPPWPEFSPNPVIGFAIRPRKSGIAMRLQMSPQVRWEERPALEDLMVFAWAPCNAGVDKNSLYAFIGLSPAPMRGEFDVTKLYMEKLKEWRRLKHRRYHIPLEGSRIFIQVRQQVNGWENELGVFRADALVPGSRWPRWVRKTGEK